MFALYFFLKMTFSAILEQIAFADPKRWNHENPKLYFLDGYFLKCWVEMLLDDLDACEMCCRDKWFEILRGLTNLNLRRIIFSR